VLQVDYFRVPLGTILLGISLSLCVSALGLLIGVVAESDNQVVLYSLLAMFVFSALGGTWFPVESAGNAFRAISRLVHSTWAMIGMQNILIRGLDLASLW
jgi:ABC-type multidrug transport system permease subunit